MQYDYYLIVSEHFPRDNPYALIRVRRGEPVVTGEESFSPAIGWKRNNMLYRINAGGMDREAEPLTAAEAERYVELLTRRHQEG